MTGEHADLKAWPSVPADRDLPPGRHDLHREILMNHIHDERPPAPARSHARPRAGGTGWRSRRRRVAVVAVSVAFAAGAVGYAVIARAAAPPTRRVPASQPATLAAKVLRDAAAHVARETPIAEARPGQWIYTKTVYAGYNNSNPSAEQYWITFDGKQNAYHPTVANAQHLVVGYSRQLIVHTNQANTNQPRPGGPPWTAWNKAVNPMTACNVLASLPANPKQALAVIAAHMGTISEMVGDGILSSGPATRPQAEFAYLTNILWNTTFGAAGCPPAAMAPAYRALAAIPGVSVQTDITDAVGAPVIGISDDGGYTQLLLSPTSYEVIGSQSISNGINPRLGLRLSPRARAALRRRESRARGGNLSYWPPKGEVVSSTTLVQTAEVAAPGDV